jgi:hypothetical protein
MAKLIPRSDPVPPELADYDPEYHGEGQEGIRRWSRAAQAYLADDPQRRLNGRDMLGVIRHAVELQGGFDPPAGKQA